MLSSGSAFALGMFAEAPQASPFLGIVTGQQWVYRFDRLFDAQHPWPSQLPAPVDIFSLLQSWDACFAALQSAVATRLPDLVEERQDIAGLHALAPIDRPRQVICTGANYRKHVIDLVVAQGGGADTEGMTLEERRAHVTRRMDARAVDGLPYAFPKLSGCVTGPSDDIVIPHDAEQFDWELELGLVIGREAWRVAGSAALGCIAGYVIVNDLTRRELVYRPDLKSLGSDWLRAKSGPGFLPTGPLFVPAAFVAHPQDLEIRLELNGQVMQCESTADMIFGIDRQIEYLSAYVRLFPGDLIATGSPAGNGMHHKRFLQPGDVMRGSIAGLGVQVNRLVAEGV